MVRSRFAAVVAVLTLLCLTACAANTAAPATATPAPTPVPLPTATPAPARATAVIFDTPTPGQVPATAATAVATAAATTAEATAAMPTITPIIGTATPDPLLQRPETPTNQPGRILVLSVTGALFLTKPDGKTPQRLSAEYDKAAPAGNTRFFLYPSLSPDGKMVVAFGIGQQNNADIYGTYLLNSDGSSATKGPQAISESATYKPIYFSWSPDSTSVTILQQIDSALQFLVSPARGTVISATATTPVVASADVRSLATTSGNFYSSWSPDSATLLFHAGGSHSDSTDSTIGQVAARTANAPVMQVSNSPSAFRAPAWSHDGKQIAYATQVADYGSDPKPESLVVRAATGGTATEIGRTGPGAVFSWSPTDNTLALSWLTDTQNQTYDGIYLGKPGGGAPDHIVTGDVLAYFWSPDGTKIAYVTRDPAVGTPPLVWNVYDLKTKKSQPVISFYPSQSLLQVLTYFDQYGQSDAIWSPDSSAFVFAGWAGADLNNTGEPVNTKMPKVYIASPTTRPCTLGDGELASWSRL